MADVYRGALLIQTDSLVEGLISALEPPHPVPPLLRAPLDSLIATLNNPERRQVLRARYLGVKP
jgi:hypothetical protein